MDSLNENDGTYFENRVQKKRDDEIKLYRNS